MKPSFWGYSAVSEPQGSCSFWIETTTSRHGHSEFQTKVPTCFIKPKRKQSKKYKKPNGISQTFFMETDENVPRKPKTYVFVFSREQELFSEVFWTTNVLLMLVWKTLNGKWRVCSSQLLKMQIWRHFLLQKLFRHFFPRNQNQIWYHFNWCSSHWQLIRITMNWCICFDLTICLPYQHAPKDAASVWDQKHSSKSMASGSQGEMQTFAHRGLTMLQN